MKKPYHIVSRDAACASAQIEKFAKANGQVLLPLVELSTQSRIAVDEVMQPREENAQALNLMRAAWKLSDAANEGLFCGKDELIEDGLSRA